MSTLEQSLADYLQLRHCLGHELADAGRLLPDFVAYLDASGLGTVTVLAALEWAQQSSPTGRVSSVGPRRMSAVRGFARYLSGIEASTQVPPMGLMPHGNVGVDRSSTPQPTSTRCATWRAAPTSRHCGRRPTTP